MIEKMDKPSMPFNTCCLMSASEEPVSERNRITHLVEFQTLLMYKARIGSKQYVWADVRIREFRL